MLSRSNALRLHVESALAGRVVSPFRFQEPQPVTASAGIAAVDQLAGGLPRGCLTEIFGENTSTILLILSRECNAETCASLVLRMETGAARWSLQDRQYPSRDFHTPASLLDGWTTTAEMIRSKARRKNVAVIDRAKSFSGS